MKEKLIHVVFVEESYENGHLWAAQCLEYDIAAQGKTIDEAEDSFKRVFYAQALHDVEHGTKPFAEFTAAPQEYWDLVFRRSDKIRNQAYIYFYKDNKVVFK